VNTNLGAATLKADGKPAWNFNIPEDTARWVLRNPVTKISHHWEMTSVDTSRDWLVLHSGKRHIEVPTNFLKLWPELRFEPTYRGQLEFNPHLRVAETIAAIGKWRNHEARDLAEYARLKAKFEGAGA
jgi:hypothetical protein